MAVTATMRPAPDGWTQRRRRQVRRAIADRTLGRKVWRWLARSVSLPVSATVQHARLGRADRRLALGGGFADHRDDPRHDPVEPSVLRRIIEAHKASLAAKAAMPSDFRVRGLWAEHLDLNYGSLRAALEHEDVPTLTALLENFNRETFAIGEEGSYQVYAKYRRSPIGRMYARNIWVEYRDRLAAAGFDPREVRAPLIGNPAGLEVNGTVIPARVFRHTYHALEMRDWLHGSDRATVVEIGGGTGEQAFQTVSVARHLLDKYVIFDVPEVAAVAAYFLIAALPDQRIRLFGEGPVDISTPDEYDVGIFPHFLSAELPDDSVDLFYNADGFSEMDRRSARAYLSIVERTCRHYFSHVNDEGRLTYRLADGSVSVNVSARELVPDPTRFRRVFRKPRVFRLAEHRSFEYLYERVSRHPSRESGFGTT